MQEEEEVEKGEIEDKRYAPVQEREEHIFYLSLYH
jgi:hypothetical protein